MGFRFHRTLRLLPGLRLNLSKSGVSASIGVRGAHYTIGPKGTRTTVGLPGSGLSYTEYKAYPPQERPSEDQPRKSGRHYFLHFMLWLAVIMIGFAIAVAIMTPAHAASNDDCKTFVYLAIATTHATEECDIDYMDDPGVMRITDAMAAAKCPARIGKAGIDAQAERARAMWGRLVKSLGKAGACAKMTASMEMLR